MADLSALTWRDGAVLLLQTVFFYLPAVAANIAPLFASLGDKRMGEQKKVVRRWYNHPIWEEALGENKTWRGLAVGIIAAGFMFWGLKDLHFTGWQWVDDASIFDYQNESVVVMAVLLGGGALLGDIVKSFFKRRIPMEPSHQWWPNVRAVPSMRRRYPPSVKWYPMDQIDFILGASFCMWIAGYPMPWPLFVTALLMAAVIQPLCRKGFHAAFHKFFPHLTSH